MLLLTNHLARIQGKKAAIASASPSCARAHFVLSSKLVILEWCDLAALLIEASAPWLVLLSTMEDVTAGTLGAEQDKQEEERNEKLKGVVDHSKVEADIEAAKQVAAKVTCSRSRQPARVTPPPEHPSPRWASML